MTATAFTPTISKGRPPGCRAVGVPVAITGMKVTEYGGDGFLRMTRFKFRACSLTITDALAYLGTKIYDFPQGTLNVFAASFRGTLTTTSAIASTLNSGVAVNIGFGSATASNVTLSSTMMNFLPGSGETAAGFTSSTTINVASAAVNMALAAPTSAAHLAANIAGHATAADLYLNLAVATATDIDADATVELNGEFLIAWMVTLAEAL